ncbi:MAG: glucose/galactose MFS transporter, partial [Verrucomicrobiaceae bacterium]
MKHSHAAVEAASLTTRQTNISIAIIGVLFFVFGFVSWINAILIPYFK